MAELLEIDSVQLSFDSRKILQNVYAKAETGRVTGLLGRNGCGKSSLLRILYGEKVAQEQSVRINGKALLTNYRSPALMRMLPHFSILPLSFPIATVFDDFEVDYDEFLHLFGEFEKVRNNKIRELSGGNVRTIEVYVLLKSASKFCLLDEPFTHLSPKNTAVFCELITDEKRRKGIVITDHYYRSVMSVSDDLYLIANRTTYEIRSKDDLVRYGYLLSSD